MYGNGIGKSDTTIYAVKLHSHWTIVMERNQTLVCGVSVGKYSRRIMPGAKHKVDTLKRHTKCILVVGRD